MINENISIFTALVIALFGVLCFVFGMVIYKWLLKEKKNL